MSEQPKQAWPSWKQALVLIFGGLGLTFGGVGLGLFACSGAQPSQHFAILSQIAIVVVLISVGVFLTGLIGMVIRVVRNIVGKQP